MHPIFAPADAAPAIPILFVNAATFEQTIAGIDEREQTYVRATGYEPKPGRQLIVPKADGTIAGVLFGIEAADEPQKDLLRPGQLVTALPAGLYRFANPPHDARLAALSFALSAYQFARYRKAEKRNVQLAMPPDVNGDDISRIAEGVYLTRNLINTPSNEMGPDELEDAARKLAEDHGASFDVTRGNALARDYPLIQAVGMGSPRAPRLIDITWGEIADPKITLVGKGVCFDTGGLDIKPDSGMLNMKKDMGGAATALGLAHMIMSAKLKVRLRVLIPAVENSVSGTSFRPRDIAELIHLARRFGNFSAEEMAATVRFWTMSIADFLDEYFETDVVKAYLALSGIIGTALGPMSPGTAYVLLHHYMGEVDGSVGAWGYARGGMGAVTQALASSFRAAGGTIRTDAGVAKVLTRNGRAAGVVLETGEEIAAARVVSNADVKRTFLTLVDPADLPEPFLHRVRHFKMRGSSGKLNIALDGLPDFPALPQGSRCTMGDMHFTDSVERMERGYDDWKAGRWSADPFVDMMIPTQLDPTMAPPGQHFMSCFVQYCPPKVEGRDWTDADRTAFAETVVSQISEYSPGFRDRIIGMEVRTPRELEAEVGLTEGNIFQGELTFDQLLFNRPVPGYAQYRSPIAGLYLCGSSTHPGGGVMGAPGRNAAREILRDLRMSPKEMRPAHDVL